MNLQLLLPHPKKKDKEKIEGEKKKKKNSHKCHIDNCFVINNHIYVISIDLVI